jgi:hypothetical protein
MKYILTLLDVELEKKNDDNIKNKRIGGKGKEMRRERDLKRLNKMIRCAAAAMHSNDITSMKKLK